MTQTLAVTDRNDIYIGANGNLAMAANAEAVKLACASASKAQLGEMVLAVLLGIPNFQVVWVGAPNIAIFERYLRNALLAVPGVTGIKSLTTSESDNKLKYVAEINTIYGEVTANG